MTKLIDNFDVHKFVEEYYEPVEDKSGYVWLSKRNMQIINIDVLVASIQQKAKKIIKMRDATSEERESIDKYIKNISKPTGVDLWDLEQDLIPTKQKRSEDKA